MYNSLFSINIFDKYMAIQEFLTIRYNKLLSNQVNVVQVPFIGISAHNGLYLHHKTRYIKFKQVISTLQSC